MEAIVQRFVHADDLGDERGWRLIKWCAERGGDEFTFQMMGVGDAPNSPKPLAEALASFHRGTSRRENMMTLAGDAARRPTETWRLTTESAAVLRQHVGDGLFGAPSYSTGGWIEDFTIYRRGEIILGVVSHERLVSLRLTEREHGELSALGICSHEVPPRKTFDSR